MQRKRGLSTGAVVAIVGGGVALVLVIAAGIVAILVSRSDTVRLRATGVGMEPTIRAGQTITAAEVGSGAYRPEHGDIVVFAAPAAWMTTDRDQKFVKRVIGLPGDHLSCCDSQGRWTIDGTPLTEPYIKAGGGITPSMNILVPDGRLWVMGDNRDASNDSRTRFAATDDITTATIPLSSISAVVRP